MDNTTIYALIGGLFLGKYTNIVSNAVISGLLLYFSSPSSYTYESFMNILKNENTQQIGLKLLNYTRLLK